MAADFDARAVIQELTSREALSSLFGRLGYDAESAMKLTPEALGLKEKTAEAVREVWRLALGRDTRQPELFQVHFFLLKKVTQTLIREIERPYRQKAGAHLLVLTSDWETLDFAFGRDSRERARVQTLERSRPSQVHQRFVSQLRWAARTSIEQGRWLDKAFDTAEWADELFNNRALFSNHVLETRLPEHTQWTAVREVEWRELRRIYRDLPQGERVERVVQKLGFERSEEGDKGSVLTGTDGHELALFEEVEWAVPLDVRDPEASAEATPIPGIKAVERLQEAEGRGGASWLILTNGETWRLYSREAHSRASNYYEIDLQGLLLGTSAEEASAALRYFMVLFRRQAFEPEPGVQREGQAGPECLLDWLFRESQDFAKQLGERLKDKVFEDVFEILATGFLAGAEEALPQEELDRAFRGTLTFLYRVLFVLYAEARDLLPVREQRGYYLQSLRKLTREIAGKAGPAQSDFDKKLEQAYSDEKFELDGRLRKLFEMVDRGDVDANVPPYNGGLFLTEPSENDTRLEAEAARFLIAHPLNDRALARALDRLAREEDSRRHELVPVDYRSLGVRQLGSIYEGLLEFQLRQASEPMAIVQGKKSKKAEKVLPLAEARKLKLKILTVGKGKNAEERILQPGSLYLENDRRERRATGSFYTPDFVVEYIVEKTVGPLLEEKLEALRPQLRKAEEWRHRQKKMAPAKGEDPAKYERGPAVEGEWTGLVQEFFDFKVLDPAMGSGHFLVEAVDFITDHMLRFLSKFPWNPISCHLDILREEIRQALSEKGIAINESRLTDVNLLKRHVLKRCIYGVDRNPMAVELAKVSLWLDCFTLGAPLSFLDHHLRCGNSLLGVEVAEVRKEVEHQGTLFGSSFAALQLATAAMTLVGKLPDVTPSQIQKSRSSFDDAAAATLPFRRILDVYLSGWFLQETAKPGKKSAKGSVEVVAFLKSQGHEILGERDSAAFEQRLRELKPEIRELVENGLSVAAEERFFHWELELPEAFSNDIEAQHGFDVVIGNPPWIRQESLKQHKKAYASLYDSVFAAEADIYVYFIARAAQILRQGGKFGLVLQNKWLKAGYAGKLRHFLVRNLRTRELIDFGHAPLFEDADTFPCVLLGSRSDAGSEEPINFVSVARSDLPIHDLAAFVRMNASGVEQKELRREGWQLLPGPLGQLMAKIRHDCTPLGQIAGRLYRGVTTGLNEAFLIDESTRSRILAEDPRSEELLVPFLRGADISRWHSKWSGDWMLLALHGFDIAGFPAIERHLEQFRNKLEPRPLGFEGDTWSGRKAGSYRWFEIQDSVDYHGRFLEPKIVYQDLGFSSRFAFDSTGVFLANTCYFFPSVNLALLAILNSSVIWWILPRLAQRGKTETLRLHSIYVENLPIPVLPPHLDERLVNLTRRLISLSQQAGVQSPQAEAAREIARAEIELHHLAFEAYGLSPEDVTLLRKTAPPRDPLTLAEEELRSLGEEP